MRGRLYFRVRPRFASTQRLWCVLVATSLWIALCPAFAQDLPRVAAGAIPSISPNSPPTFSKRVDEVHLVFSVTDKLGRFADDLQMDDFQLFDNNLPPERVYNFQQHSDLPLQVVLLVDISSSIEYRFPFEQKAAVAFLRHVLRPETDAGAVIAFGSRVQRVQPLTTSIDDLETAVYCLNAFGETALYDAIVMASKSFSPQMTSQGARKVMILLTDGEDTISAAMESKALMAAVESDAIVLVVDASTTGSRDRPGELFLEKLTVSSGGTILRAADDSEFKRSLRKIEKVLRTQYSLSYKPAGFETDGTYHAIRVNPQKPKLTVRCRAGYYARAK